MSVKRSEKKVSKWTIEGGPEANDNFLEITSDANETKFRVTVKETYQSGMFDYVRNQATINLTLDEMEELCKDLLDRIREMKK